MIAKKALEKVKFPKHLTRVELVVDKCKNNHEMNIFNEYLSNHLAAHLPLQAKLTIDHIPSFKHTGLQAVDLFSWGIFRKYENKDEDWYSEYSMRINSEEVI